MLQPEAINDKTRKQNEGNSHLDKDSNEFLFPPIRNGQGDIPQY